MSEYVEKVHTIASKRAAADAALERSDFDIVAPSAAMQPLSPPLSILEYEAMERDTAK